MNDAVISQVSTLDSLFPNKKWYWNILNQAILKNKMNIAHYSWHESIFIPTAIWLELYDKELESSLTGVGGEKLEGKTLNALICSLMVLSSWKNSQGNFIVDDYCWEQMFRKTKASIVSAEQLSNIEEWTVYFPLKNTYFNKKKVHGFYIHKNNFDSYGRDKKPDILIMTFNIGDVAIIKDNPHGKRTKHNKNKRINAMPYAIFRIDKTRRISEALIECHDLPILNSNAPTVEEFFAPYFSLINFFGDQQTLIESEIVGPMRPTYRDIKFSLTYDSYNNPVFRYINPSNIRTWHVGLSFGVNYRMALRRERLVPENKAVGLSWEIDPETLKLKLIVPHNKSHGVPESLDKILSEINLNSLFKTEN